MSKFETQVTIGCPAFRLDALWASIPRARSSIAYASLRCNQEQRPPSGMLIQPHNREGWLDFIKIYKKSTISDCANLGITSVYHYLVVLRPQVPFCNLS